MTDKDINSLLKDGGNNQKEGTNKYDVDAFNKPEREPLNVEKYIKFFAWLYFILGGLVSVIMFFVYIGEGELVFFILAIGIFLSCALTGSLLYALLRILERLLAIEENTKKHT